MSLWPHHQEGLKLLLGEYFDRLSTCQPQTFSDHDFKSSMSASLLQIYTERTNAPVLTGFQVLTLWSTAQLQRFTLKGKNPENHIFWPKTLSFDLMEQWVEPSDWPIIKTCIDEIQVEHPGKRNPDPAMVEKIRLTFVKGFHMLETKNTHPTPSPQISKKRL